MAWPCISRVCCLARFWSQMDKSDLSVPLTIQNYSDIAEQEVRSVTKRVPTDRVTTKNFSAPDHHHRGSPQQAPGGDAPPGSRGSFRGRKEPSYKPREDYHPPGVPFQSVTQYKQDFKPWPIPKRDNFPWISNGGGRAAGGGSVPDSPVNGSHNASQQQQQLAERVDRGERSRGHKCGEEQQHQHTGTSCYRQEYRPWTGVRPAKSTRRSPSTAPYASPVSEASRPSPETSYQAAYSVEAHKPTALHHQADHVSATAATQPIPAPLQAGGIPSPSNRQQSSAAPERPDLSVSTKEQLVKTKLSPNPSAVFQSRSRVFNI